MCISEIRYLLKATGAKLSCRFTIKGKFKLFADNNADKNKPALEGANQCDTPLRVCHVTHACMLK